MIIWSFHNFFSFFNEDFLVIYLLFVFIPPLSCQSIKAITKFLILLIVIMSTVFLWLSVFFFFFFPFTNFSLIWGNQKVVKFFFFPLFPLTKTELHLRFTIQCFFFHFFFSFLATSSFLFFFFLPFFLFCPLLTTVPPFFSFSTHGKASASH